MRQRSRSDQIPRLLGAVGLAAVVTFVAGPAVTGATLVASTDVQSAPIQAGTWSMNQYQPTVLSTSPVPVDYLRLSEQTPVTFVQDLGSRGVTAVGQGSPLGWGAPGLLLADTDTALSFDGDPSGQPNVRVGGPATSAPSDFTVTAWVDATAGGRILGFGDASGDAPDAASAAEDRVLYVDDAGYLRGAIRDSGGTVTAVRSDAPVVGAAHHVALSLGPAGLLLYVDGALQTGSDPGTTTAKAYAGWWRIGWDSLPVDYPGLASADGLMTGTVDEVAIWNAQLSGVQVSDLAGANHP